MISFPNCKINIGLHITEKRADGFHNLESIMTPVFWNDILEIVKGEENASDVEYKSTGIRIYGAKETNLCVKAYQLLAKDFSLPPLKIHLHKIIPIGAGLGGGSSDAAFALSMLNSIFKLNINEETLDNYAARLGSDCPFFLHNKTIFAYERGDKFEQVKTSGKEYVIVLVKPKVHVNTTEAYSWIKPVKRKQSLKDLIQQPIESWKENIFNDFETPVFEKYPAIKNIKARLYKLGALYASMSGSGSTVFGIFQDEKHLDTYFRSSTIYQGKITI
ncbi:MAG: 4-(cytidine 5'-diphospho)-2-C-methyl-D-erythritol kinase [Bacteroidetes bacterium]|nr:4-(cytidine 5'-diphospho)-2-C-methyl-D-erythritol kinase [Bacteroidota bacterium]